MASGFWDSETPIAIAHRGGNAAGDEKENTLEAFQAAADLGYEYIETDVILAASGELVLVHGSENWLHASISRGITRYTLQKMTLDQMSFTLKPGGGQVPTLEEVLKAFPKIRFILDLKTDEAAAPLGKLVKRLKAEDRVCLTGFDFRRIAMFEAACGKGRVSTCLTIGRGVRFRNMNMFMLKSGRLKDVEAIFLHHSLISPPMVGLVHRRGFKAVVWTANSRIAINNAIRSGADGIISDRVELLKELIEKKTKQK
jgi:glycerophosphoryl diester phosphodiesterase